MQKIAAIHDGSSQGWETIYLAFHLAARLGAALWVFTLPSSVEGGSASEQSEKIHTGGRAAGLSVETRSIDTITAGAILQHSRDIYTLLLPKDLPGDEGLAPELARGLSCPIWMVTRKYDIRQLGVWLEAASEGPASRYTTALARRLGRPVVYFSSHSPAAVSTDVDIVWKDPGEFSPAAVAEQVRVGEIDLLVFGAEEEPLFQGCRQTLDCILTLCPPEKESRLTSD